MKILVTGATGFIGFEVARVLASRVTSERARPRLLVRRPRRGLMLAGLDAELVQGDLTSHESLVRAVAGVDGIIHLGARATFEEFEALKPTIIDGSLALMRAAAEAGVKVFIQGSSLMVYPSSSRAVDAATQPAPVLDYGRAKLAAEKALMELAASAGLAYGSLRLPHVYGPGDLLFGQVRDGLLWKPGHGNNRFGHLHVRDCARLLIAACQQGYDKHLPVADEDSATWNEFYEVIKLYYPGLKIIEVPEFLAKLGGQLLTPWRRLTGKPSLKTADAVKGFNLSIPVDPGLVWPDLGLTPEFPSMREGVPAVLDDCLSFRWEHPLKHPA